MTAWCQEVQACLASEGIPVDAQAMSAYMKGLFPFLGLKKPLRAALTKPLFERANLPSKAGGDRPFTGNRQLCPIQLRLPWGCKGRI
ncbi:MAG: hypothetical protein EBZ26_02370 [Flavobacteriia bacterium]|nr:hypothetical protein [Flavobacteriia bacterium]